MIVKNEAKVIARCLESVKPLIDYWLIIDTGSTDDTEATVRAALAGIPGEFLQRPWVDFGHNRTELVQHARGRADYLLLLDADMEVVVGAFQKRFDADAYLLNYSGQLDYSQKLFVRSDLDWKYVGTTHEYIHCNDRQSVKLLKTLTVIHHADGGCRDEKLTRDEALLEKAVALDPHDPRAVFYLAQTYRDAGNLDAAIEMYRRRASMGGWDEEVWYATYQTGRLLEQAGRWEAAFTWLLKAFELRPSRAESLHAIAAHFRLSRQYHLASLFASRAAEIAYPTDLLFVERDVYEYRIDDERSISAYYAGRPTESSAICRNLLESAALPEAQRPRIRENKAFADAKRKQLILGLGTGRCGTKSLAKLLNAQRDIVCGHESLRTPWVYDRTVLDHLLQRLQGYESPCAGIVASYLLHYVEPLLKLEPDARVVCLKRDRTETVDSFMKWTPRKNHWTARNSRHWCDDWISDEYDDSYPQFDADKQDAIGLYWDHYYAFVAYLEQRFFKQVRQFTTDDLNTVEGQRAILSFAGVSDDAASFNPGIRENQGVVE